MTKQIARGRQGDTTRYIRNDVTRFYDAEYRELRRLENEAQERGDTEARKFYGRCIVQRDAQLFQRGFVRSDYRTPRGDYAPVVHGIEELNSRGEWVERWS